MCQYSDEAVTGKSRDVAGRKTEPHQQVVGINDVLSSVPDSANGSFLLCEGRYSPDPTVSQRILAFQILNTRLKKAFDGWLRTDDVDLLKAAAGEKFRPAQCDAMYATPAKYVWSIVDGLLSIWSHRWLNARIGSEVVELRDRLGGWTSFSTSEFTMCHGFLSDSWATRGVRLKRRWKKHLVIAKRTEPLTFIDPTYDGLDLMAETEWVSDLAYAVAEATQLPVKVHKYLG